MSIIRSYYRHPTDMPIELLLDAQQVADETLCNVSSGGLCFRYTSKVEVGNVIRVRIAITAPPFEARCRVTWCQPEGGTWQVGVVFLEQDDLFRARMIEQICHIQQYRDEIRDKHGRNLSSQEAAVEWIEKFADKFQMPERSESGS